jgi:hypothetical protein
MVQALTSLAKFKSWYGLKAEITADDDMISDIIDGVSADILAYLDRKSLFKQVYPEYMNGTGGPVIILKQWPVLSVSSLTVDGTAQTAAVQPNVGYFLDPWDDIPPGRPQSISMIGGSTAGANCMYGGAYFNKGIKNVYVNYTAGYSVSDEAATIPASPYQVTVTPDFGVWGQDDGITLAGVAMTKVTTAPAAGQYSVDEGVYTFAAANTGGSVLISYSYVPQPLAKACNMMVGETYAYRQRIGQKSHTIQGQTTVSFDNSLMTPAIMNMLQPYKRMVPF